MNHRSWLFVPGNSEKKLSKSVQTGADVVVELRWKKVEESTKPEGR